MNNNAQSWSDVEQALTGVPRHSQAAFAARAARRIGPVVLLMEPLYGPETREWLAALNTALDAVEHFAAGEAVSRFNLDLAAEIARATATATANAARLKGPSSHMEDAEMAYAAVAFAADCARTSDDRRAATLAMQSARAAAKGGEVPAEQSLDLRLLMIGEALDPLRPLGWDRAAAVPRLVVCTEGTS